MTDNVEFSIPDKELGEDLLLPWFVQGDGGPLAIFFSRSLSWSLQK